MRKLIPLLFILIGCSKEEEALILSKKTFSLKIDSVLNSTGTRSILYDNNGYYHLKLDVTRNQTLSTVKGKILEDSKEPYPPEKFDWESNSRDELELINLCDTK